MKIAVTSQNRRTITEHAGKCRKFWVYDIEQGQVTGKTLLELPIEQRKIIMAFVKAAGATS